MMKTLPTLIKRKHARKGEKKKQGPKSRQANSPKETGHKEEMQPLSTRTSSTSYMKHIN
jgi:hypothetical protein